MSGMGSYHRKPVRVDWELEPIVVPVSDMDRSKQFYADQAGFTLDVDHRA